MLGSTLRRAEIQLQAHRNWLRQFQRIAGGHHVHHGLLQPLKAHREWTATCGHLNFGTATIRAYSIKHGRIKKRVRSQQNALQERYAESQIHVAELLKAADEYQINELVRLYDTLPDKSLLEPLQLRSITQCLHRCLRRLMMRSETAPDAAAVESLVNFAYRLIDDIKKAILRPSSQAHVHLISMLNEAGKRDRAISFWKWLENQDDRIASPETYGAALELLAMHGAPLVELEELYQKALNRFPGNFNAYHLSHNAIVPDRAQPIRIKGIPTTLLQGIATARVLRGDIQNAYLNLDTGLRLFPDQLPHRFFNVFMAERPLIERYILFAIACRAGIKLPTHQYKKLVVDLGKSVDSDPVTKHLTVLRSIISLTYLYLGCGGRLYSNAISDLVISMTRILRLHGIHEAPQKTRAQIVNTIMDMIRTALELFARYHSKPNSVVFNSIIVNVGGFGRTKRVIDVALADMQALGIPPTDVTQRSVLTAAGLLQDKKLVMQSWKNLVDARIANNQAPGVLDFHVLVKAAHLSGQIPYATQQFQDLKENLPVGSHDGIEARLANEGSHERPAVLSTDLDFDSLRSELSKVQSDLNHFVQATKDGPHIQNFDGISLLMTPLTLAVTQMPEDEMRRIYNEMSTEQGSSRAASGADTSDLQDASSRTLTNIPFDTLRYENWKSINYLLELAEVEVNSYKDAVDNAIATGVSPPLRQSTHALPDARSWGLHDIYNAGKVTHGSLTGTDKWSEQDIRRNREKILKLRAVQI